MSSLEESSLEDAAEALEDDGASVLFLRHGLDGELVDTLARRSGEKMLMKTSGSGDMTSIDLLRVPFSRRPTAYVRNPGGRERDEAWIRERLEQYRTLDLPESLPGYTDILFADTGDIWARRYRMRGESMDRWDVFASDGAYLGRVHIPTSFRVEEVSRGQIVGIATDELGVERVEVRDLSFSGR